MYLDPPAPWILDRVSVSHSGSKGKVLWGKCLLRRGKKLVSGCMLFVVVGSIVISPEFVLILPLIHLVPLFLFISMYVFCL